MPGLSTANGGLLVVAIIALSTAFRAIESRRLLGRLDDPLFPERLFASRKRTSTVATLAAAVLGAAAPRLVLVSLPLLLIANAAAGFRLRRAIYEESWRFPAFLSFHTRLFIGVYGFWLLLFVLPFTAGAFGTRLLTVPLAMAAGLLAWEHWHARALRALVRARPIEDEKLLRAFEDLVARTGLVRPAFEVATPEGGTVVNALALPASNGSAVLFSATLLERFELDEIVAVCAHELAHLEYYDAKRLAQYRWATRGLILLGAAGIPAAARMAPPVLATLLWAAAFLAAIALRVRHRQRNETASDCRAVELTGAPDAMARALTRLHTAMRLPRRYDPQFERRATHPSLARRIRDLYTAAGFSPVPLDAPAAVIDEATGTRVTFGADGLVWARDGAEHRLGYRSLSELRLVARPGSAALTATDRDGRRWEIPVADPDIASIQSVLDRVDGHLGPPAAARRPQALLARLVLAGVSTIAVLSGQFACAFVALVAFTAPSMRLLAGAGMASLVGTALLARQGRGVDAAVLFTAGTALLGCAFLRRQDTPEHRERGAAVLLGAMTAAALIAVTSGGITAFRLHQAARALPAAAVLLVACAAAVRTGSSTATARRYLAILLGATGLAVAYAGSDAFVTGFVEDPLLVRAPEIVPAQLSGTPAARFPVPFTVAEASLSAAGDAVILWRDEEDAGPAALARWTMEAGPLAGPRTRYAVDDAVFTPEGRLLAVAFDDGQATVWEGAAGADLLWKATVPGISTGRIALAPDDRSWVLLGWNERAQPIRATGARRAGAGIATSRWAGVPGVSYVAVASLGEDALALEKHYLRPPLPTALLRWAPLLPYRTTARVWQLAGATARPLADSLLDVSCQSGPASGQLVCAAYDGSRTRISAFTVASARVLPLATVPGRFTAYASHASRGWLSGWRDNTPLAIRLDALDAFEAPAARDTFVRGLFGSGNRIGAIAQGDDGTTVSIYEVAARR